MNLEEGVADGILVVDAHMAGLSCREACFL